jgi:hypothetical protein
VTKHGKAARNLLVAAINTAIERQLLTLRCEPVGERTFEFTLAEHQVTAWIDDAGFDEVCVHTIVEPTPLGRSNLRAALNRDHCNCGEACALGWLERRSGTYLQTGASYHGERSITDRLAALSLTPSGFGTDPTDGGYDFARECRAAFGSRGFLLNQVAVRK